MATLTLDQLVAQLQAVYGASLRTVVLYGSGATGEHLPKRSDLNILVLVERLGMDELRRAAAVAQAWGDAGHPAPLTMTLAEWRASSDVFPMEYADILDHHRVLFGTPPFDGIAVDPKDLRLQLEHEAMGKMLQLRQGIMAAGGDEKALLELLAASLSTVMVIFRAVVRLHGASPATEYEALVRDVASRVGFDGEPFLRVVRHARGSERLSRSGVSDVLPAYLSGLQQLVSHLDRF